MSNKLTPKIILVGTCLTFKTEIAIELKQHPEQSDNKVEDVF